MFKTCTKCGVTHPVSGFTKSHKTSDGMFSWCKVCTSERCKLYRNSTDKTLTHDGYVAMAKAMYVYDSESGKLLKKDGMKAVGTVGRCGHIYVMLNKKKVEAHRVIWMVVYGEYPVNQIDHINGVRDDNRLSNLRHVTASVNQQNQRGPQKRNATGLLGVTKGGNQYVANITVDGKRIYLGRFVTAELAHAAYVAAKRELHEGCTI